MPPKSGCAKRATPQRRPHAEFILRGRRLSRRRKQRWRARQGPAPSPFARVGIRQLAVRGRWRKALHPTTGGPWVASWAHPKQSARLAAQLPQSCGRVRMASATSDVLQLEAKSCQSGGRPTPRCARICQHLAPSGSLQTALSPCVFHVFPTLSDKQNRRMSTILVGICWTCATYAYVHHRRQPLTKQHVHVASIAWSTYAFKHRARADTASSACARSLRAAIAQPLQPPWNQGAACVRPTKNVLYPQIICPEIQMCALGSLSEGTCLEPHEFGGRICILELRHAADNLRQILRPPSCNGGGREAPEYNAAVEIVAWAREPQICIRIHTPIEL